MTALLCPIFQDPQFTDNGEFLSGGLLWFYEAGTSTLANAYTTDIGDVAWSNPIVLNSRGETGGTIWLANGQSYRIVLEGKPYYGQTHGTVITEHDDIAGIPVAVEASEWTVFPNTASYISVTSFTVAGDYRDIFAGNRKIRVTDSGGVSTHSVESSTFESGVTTVNITGTIDSGLSLVEYSFITPDAAPDRFTNLTAEDLTVGDDLFVGDSITAGSINVNGDDVWTKTNNTVTNVGGNVNVTFENGLKIYTYAFNVTVANGETVSSKSGTHSFPNAFPNACFQAIACFGDGAQGAGTISIAVTSVSASGFSYIVKFVTNILPRWRSALYRKT
jgi:hypothetical protein